MSELEASLAILVGRQATDQDRQELHRVRDALTLKANDALWSVLLVLQRYEWLHGRHAAIAETGRVAEVINE